MISRIGKRSVCTREVFTIDARYKADGRQYNLVHAIATEDDRAQDMLPKLTRWRVEISRLGWLADGLVRYKY